MMRDDLNGIVKKAAVSLAALAAVAASGALFIALLIWIAPGTDKTNHKTCIDGVEYVYRGDGRGGLAVHVDRTGAPVACDE